MVCIKADQTVVKKVDWLVGMMDKRKVERMVD